MNLSKLSSPLPVVLTTGEANGSFETAGFNTSLVPGRPRIGGRGLNIARASSLDERLLYVLSMALLCMNSNAVVARIPYMANEIICLYLLSHSHILNENTANRTITITINIEIVIGLVNILSPVVSVLDDLLHRSPKRIGILLFFDKSEN